MENEWVESRLVKWMNTCRVNRCLAGNVLFETPRRGDKSDRSTWSLSGVVWGSGDGKRCGERGCLHLFEAKELKKPGMAGV